MKLIIDIDENLYSYISKEDAVYFPDDGGELFEAVTNGTPLEEALEKIKSEIEEESYEMYGCAIMVDFEDVKKILNKHISELKGE